MRKKQNLWSGIFLALLTCSIWCFLLEKVIWKVSGLYPIRQKKNIDQKIGRWAKTCFLKVRMNDKSFSAMKKVMLLRNDCQSKLITNHNFRLGFSDGSPQEDFLFASKKCQFILLQQTQFWISPSWNLSVRGYLE